MRSIDTAGRKPIEKTHEFYVEIGRKGGRAGRGSEAKKRSATAAAKARWGRAKGGPVKLVMRRDALEISRKVTGLEAALRYHHRSREGQNIKAAQQVALFRNDGILWTLPTLLDRVKKFLQRKEIPFTITWDTLPAFKTGLCDVETAIVGLNYREARDIKSLLKTPVGALCKVPDASRVPIMVAVLRAYRGIHAVIVVETLDRLELVRETLQHLLGERIGILTERLQDAGRVTVMMPGYLKSDIIPPGEASLLVFDRVPRTGLTRIFTTKLKFRPIWKLGFLGNEIRGHGRMFLAEMHFGPLVPFSSFGAAHT